MYLGYILKQKKMKNYFPFSFLFIKYTLLFTIKMKELKGPDGQPT